jgi:hypothetical protein
VPQAVYRQIKENKGIKVEGKKDKVEKKGEQEKG